MRNCSEPHSCRQAAEKTPNEREGEGNLWVRDGLILCGGGVEVKGILGMEDSFADQIMSIQKSICVCTDLLDRFRAG